MILIDIKLGRRALSKKDQPNTTGKNRENLNRSNMYISTLQYRIATIIFLQKNPSAMPLLILTLTKSINLFE